ncbi:MAG: hypothetical protein KDI68_04780 [Gammaproteobacteria bacterium]|nr:hypothetical protein [Gammaproteobacteria bacterium]
MSRSIGKRNWGLLLLLFAALQLSSPLAAEESLCPGQSVAVVGGDEHLRQEICVAAARAIDFLSHYDLEPKRPIRVEVVELSLQNRSYSAFGSFDSRTGLVQVMSPQAIAHTNPEPQMYGQALTGDHYPGIVAHEIAHALLDQHSRVAPLPIGMAAQEYLAHVTQLAVLPLERREQVIRVADVGPWESGDVISGIYMAIAPERFAVKSYLHFHQHPNPSQFVDELLGSKWFYVNVP